MGSRDFRKHEAKKPKKSVKKAITTTEVAAPPMMVEVVRKPRKEREVPVE